MKRFTIRLLLMACAFDFFLPMLPGIQFHGNFFHAIGAGIFFSIMAWLVEVIAISLSAFLAITTYGIALVFLVPTWLLGFWLLPALVLKLTAGLVPEYLMIDGWGPAFWGGLVMLFISVITSDGTKCFLHSGD